MTSPAVEPGEPTTATPPPAVEPTATIPVPTPLSAGPLSAGPVTAGPVFAAPVAPVPAPIVKKSKAAPILAVLTLLLLLAAGGVTGLYLVAKKDSAKKIADQQSQIDSLRKDLTAKTDAATKAEQDLTAAKSDLDAAKKAADKTAPCVTAAKNLVEAAQKANDAASTSAATALFVNCSKPRLVSTSRDERSPAGRLAAGGRRISSANDTSIVDRRLPSWWTRSAGCGACGVPGSRSAGRIRPRRQALASMAAGLSG